jgi:hypothetical protein
MKADKNFKMPKPCKRILMTMSGENKTIYRKMIIDSVLCCEEHLKRSMRSSKTMGESSTAE